MEHCFSIFFNFYLHETVKCVLDTCHYQVLLFFFFQKKREDVTRYAYFW